MDLAQRYGRLVDVHCDEIDDPQSRFLEVLAEEARETCAAWGRRSPPATPARWVCMITPYRRCFACRKHHFISCPTESIHLQGRFDSWPKRRGVTRVAELDRAGINVCFAQTRFRSVVSKRQ